MWRGAFLPEKFAVIENGIREDFFKPGAKDNGIREEYGWQGKFIAMYVGVHGVSQGLFTLLETAERLRDCDDIRVVFVGDGADKPKMIEWVKDRGLTNVEFLPLQPKERMPDLYAAADVCFVPLRKGDYFTINIPSKVFEIMACERPIILGATGQALRIVEAAGSAIPVTPEDPASYADAVLRLRNDSDLRGRLGKNGRAFVVEHFTRRYKAEQYITVLEGAVTGDEASHDD